METCRTCNKEISDDEFVNNWGECADCFKLGWYAYLERTEQMPVTKQNVVEVFTYHSPSPEMQEKMELLRVKQIELAQLILDVVPDCADKSVALRNLRECKVNCNAAIVLNGLV
jgi:hypothetical protein